MNSSGMKPVGHMVLVKPDPKEDKTEGGIIIPDVLADRESHAQMRGEVIAVGNTAWVGIDDGSVWAKEGDRVMFAKYGGVVFKGVDDTEYRIINDEDILGIEVSTEAGKVTKLKEVRNG